VKLLIKKPLLGIIADIHNPAIGILLMLIRSIENDLIAKNGHTLYFFVSFVLFVYFVSLVSTQFVYFVDLVYFGRIQDTVRHSETKHNTVRRSETQFDKVDKADKI
jgi:hypothetical protein